MDIPEDDMTGAATGSVRTVLRLEGLSVFVTAVFAYAEFGSGWGLFAVCFLIPDVSFLGYLAGSRVGAVVYNAAHSYVGVLMAVGAAVAYPQMVPLAVGLIWGAHIGFDHMLGYGLKYPAGFGFTHLGTIGARATRDTTGNSE
jgi:hypothetical protein